MRIAREYGAVLPENGDESALVRSDRLVKFFEILGSDRCDDGAEEFAGRSTDAACDKNEPAAGVAAFYRRPQETGRLVVQPKIGDEVAIGEIGGRTGPAA